MNDKVLIVILLTLGIVLLSNLAMFAFVRGARGIKLDWFSNTDNFTQPFQKTNQELDELRQRVGKLANDSPSEGGDKAANSGQQG